MSMTPTFKYYQKQRRRKQRLTISGLALLLIIMLIVSLNTGSFRLTPTEVFQVLFSSGTPQQALILYEFRLPRMMISLLVGAGLAVSGAVLQSITRNDLADPGILGINAGASLVAVLFVAVLPTNMLLPTFALPAAAFIGAMITACIIYMLSYKRNEGITPNRILLNGIGVAAGISALTIVLVLTISPEEYQAVATWMVGSIWGTTWAYVWALLPWILILIPLVMRKAHILNVLSLNEQSIIGLGVRLEKERKQLLFFAVALAGASVSVSGSIGFVGLLAPHLTRRLIGGNHKLLIPAVAIVGALLVLTADTIGRSVFAPSEIPAGIVVAVVGAPYFLYLLRK